MEASAQDGSGSAFEVYGQLRTTEDALKRMAKRTKQLEAEALDLQVWYIIYLYRYVVVDFIYSIIIFIEKINRYGRQIKLAWILIVDSRTLAH